MNRTEIIAVNYDRYNQLPLIETALQIFLVLINVHGRPINVNFYPLIFPIILITRTPGSAGPNQTMPSWTLSTSVNADLTKHDQLSNSSPCGHYSSAPRLLYENSNAKRVVPCHSVDGCNLPGTLVRRSTRCPDVASDSSNARSEIR